MVQNPDGVAHDHSVLAYGFCFRCHFTFESATRMITCNVFPDTDLVRILVLHPHGAILLHMVKTQRYSLYHLSFLAELQIFEYRFK